MLIQTVFLYGESQASYLSTHDENYTISCLTDANMVVTFEIIFYLLLVTNSIEAVNNYCHVTIDISDGARIGTSITFEGVTYTENDYIRNSSGLFGCVCNVGNCAQECCSPGQTLDLSTGTMKCVNARSQAYTNLKSVPLHHIFHVPDREICTEEEVKITLNASEFGLEVVKGGDLIWDGSAYGYKSYCISTVDGHVIMVVCVVPDAGMSGTFYCIGMIISMPFLLATFLVYAILPDRNLHQRALMFYVLALLLSYVLLVTINLAEHLEEPWCKTMGYSTLYFFMVSFFWMNVICFDIWYTFSGGRGFVGSKRSTERKRLILYGLYAFGVPLLVIMVVYLLQIFLPEASVHHPGIGIAKCFLAEGWPSLWYFYGEAGILVIINIIFFLLTALKIRKVKQETSMLKSSDSKRHTFEKDKQKAQLYMRLLLAMGVNWSMEVISWLVNWRTNSTVQYIWYLTDFFNAMYGVFIFFLFVFKKKIWKLLQRRYYNFRGKPHLAHTMTSTNTRTSHYSSTNYSTTETNLPERSSTTNGRAQPTTVTPEEVALRRVM